MASTELDESDTGDLISISSGSEYNSLLIIDSSANSFVASDEDNEVRLPNLDEGDATQLTTSEQAAKAIEAARDHSSIHESANRLAESSAPPSVAALSIWTDDAERRSHRSYATLPNYDEATASRPTYVTPLDRDSNSLYEDGSEDGTTANTQSKRTWKKLVSRHWKILCVLNLAIYSMLVGAMISSGSPHYSSKIDLDMFDPDSPLHEANFLRSENFHPNTTACEFSVFSWYGFYHWNTLSNFSFIEDTQATSERTYDRRISGLIEVRPAPYGQNSPIEIVTSIGATASWLDEFPEFQWRENGMRVLHPSLSNEALGSETTHDALKRNRGANAACLSVWVGIYVRATPDNWDMRTENLDIDIGVPRTWRGRSSFPLLVNQNTHIFSRNGNIRIDHLVARSASISTEQGSIQGMYEFTDWLDLETVDGEIDTAILQNPFAEDGNIPQSISKLATRSRAGDQKISLRQTVPNPKKAESRGCGSNSFPCPLISKHRSVSGSIHFQASPRHWEGVVDIRARKNATRLSDHEWEKLPDPSDGNRLRAQHGQHGRHGSTMYVTSEEGDIDICVDNSRCYERLGSFYDHL